MTILMALLPQERQALHWSQSPQLSVRRLPRINRQHPKPPSSRYLKIGDNLFVSISGTASTGAPTEGEAFDEEVIAAARLKVLDEPSASSSGSKEDQLLQAMSDNFQKLQALHRTRKEKLDSRAAVVEAAEADFRNASRRCRSGMLKPSRN